MPTRTLWLLTIAVISTAACKDSGTKPTDLSVPAHDQSISVDLTQSYVGNGCGTTVCSGTTDICCGAAQASATCAASCDNTYSFKCDGPEDCGGSTSNACCLTIVDPGKATHKFSTECKANADCAPTLSITANPTVTARCHTSDDCAAFSVILSKCCHNVGEELLTFCAIPISNDAGVDVVCQD